MMPYCLPRCVLGIDAVPSVLGRMKELSFFFFFFLRLTLLCVPARDAERIFALVCLLALVCTSPALLHVTPHVAALIRVSALPTSYAVLIAAMGYRMPSDGSDTTCLMVRDINRLYYQIDGGKSYERRRGGGIF